MEGKEPSDLKSLYSINFNTLRVGEELAFLLILVAIYPFSFTRLCVLLMIHFIFQLVLIAVQYALVFFKKRSEANL